MIDRLRPAVAPAYLFLCLAARRKRPGRVGQRLAAAGRHRDHRLGAARTPRSATVASGQAAARACRLGACAGRDPAGPVAGLGLGSAAGSRAIGSRVIDCSVSIQARCRCRLLPMTASRPCLRCFQPLGMLAAMVGLRGYSAGWLAGALIGGTVRGRPARDTPG